MSAQIIDGKAIAQKVKQEVAEAVARRVAAGEVAPRPGHRARWGSGGFGDLCTLQAEGL
jgi:hypothetical protein